MDTHRTTKAPAFGYARISEDRDGRSTAPERQIADFTALAAADGHGIDRVYVDRDLSASDPRVTRPEFERMMVEASEVGATVYAYSQERLLRQPADVERVIASGVNCRFVLGDVGPLDDVSAQLMFRIKGAIGKHESDLISVRQKRKQRERAELGLPHPTRHRAFGHNAGQTAEHPDEAPIVRELVARIRAGESIPALCSDLARRGVTATTGAPWRYVPLRKLLTQARLAGAREVNGELVATGAIAPLISVDDLAAVRSILAVKTRRGAGSNARKHLLSGFAVCGICGTPLVAGARSDGRRTYNCPPTSHAFRPGCGGVSVSLERADEVVTAAVLDLLADATEVGDALAAEDQNGEVADAVAELRGIDARWMDLSADYADGIVTRAEFGAMRGRLTERRDRAERRIAAASQTTARSRLPFGKRAWTDWEVADLDWRRAVLDALVVRVVVAPTERRGRVFDPSRVAVEWIQDA